MMKPMLPSGFAALASAIGLSMGVRSRETMETMQTLRIDSLESKKVNWPEPPPAQRPKRRLVSKSVYRSMRSTYHKTNGPRECDRRRRQCERIAQKRDERGRFPLVKGQEIFGTIDLEARERWTSGMGRVKRS